MFRVFGPEGKKQNGLNLWKIILKTYYINNIRKMELPEKLPMRQKQILVEPKIGRATGEAGEMTHHHHSCWLMPLDQAEAKRSAEDRRRVGAEAAGRSGEFTINFAVFIHSLQLPSAMARCLWLSTAFG